MSVDLGPSIAGVQLSDEEVIALAREAIEASREEIRRTRNEALTADLQQPGITVDLGHKNIARLPDEVVDIIKDEIERLAISHNRVSTFPARLSECKRLRYLNVRYNQLKEIPKPILQLSSLEILDISRNRLKSLPEEIRQLSSLKVLAISRNRIEKLPLCLGDMSSLRMLKLDDNPLIFPPPEIWRPDSYVHSPSGGVAEAEAQTTTAIKRYLRQVAGVANSRQRLQVESDSEHSESAMDTPRPSRTLRTRFPVRPSLGGTDSAGNTLAISPEGSLSDLNRSYHRLKSSQNLGSTGSTRAALLSPPEAAEMSAWMADDIRNEITVRPKRHGLVTPRVTEPPAFPLVPGPSTPTEASSFPSSAFSTPDSQLPKPNNTLSYSIFNITLDLVETVINGTQQLGDRIRSLINTLDWTQHASFRDELLGCVQTFEIVATGIYTACGQAYGECETPQDTNGHFNAQLVIQRVAKPVAIALELSASVLHQISQRIGFMVLSSNAQARNAIWMLTQLDSEISGSLILLTRLLQQNHGSLLSIDVPGNALAHRSFAPEVVQKAANSSLDSPRRSKLSGSALTSTAAWQNDTERYGQLSTGDMIGLNILFDDILRALKKQVDYGSDEIKNLYTHLANEFAATERSAGQRTELGIMDNLLTHTSNYLQSVNAMREQLESVQMKESDGKSSNEFWITVTATLNDFSELGQACAGIQAPSLRGLKQEVKMVMKPLHAILKETSVLIKASPWAEWLGGGDQAKHKKNLSGGSVPPTPLSAALGPAAQAVVPAGLPGGLGPGLTTVGKAGQSRITFNDRFEKYQASQQQQRAVQGSMRRY